MRAAAEIHQMFFSFLVSEFSDARCPVSGADGRFSKTVGFWPPESKAEFRQYLPANWQLVAQSEGDLGDRMASFFETHFNEGFENVILIGADCPFVDTSLVIRTVELLMSNDVVLGPSRDGGYYLVAMKRSNPYLFQDMRWSHDQVFAETRRRIESRGQRLALLDEFFDIDTHRELECFLESSEPRFKLLQKQIRSILNESVSDGRESDGESCA